MRVYEYAKELKITTNELVKKLNEFGYEKVALSILNNDEIIEIRNKLNPKIEKKEEEKKEIKISEKKEVDPTIKEEVGEKKEEVIVEKLVFNKHKHNNQKFNNENKNQNRNFNNQGEKRNFNNFQGEKKPFNKENKENGENRRFNNNENRNQNRNFNNQGEKRNLNNSQGERKHFNRENKENLDNRKFNNNENRSQNRNFNNQCEKRNFNKEDKKFIKNLPKEDKEINIEIPVLETETKKTSGKVKSKFDKKKYENEKKFKEEERNLKELRQDFRKLEKKKKVKKKEKTSNSEVLRDEEGGVGLVVLPQEISISDLATKLGVSTSDIIKKFFMQGKVLTANAILSLEEAEEIALDYNVIVEIENIAEKTYGEKYNLEIEDKESELELRAPVITIMGHVDHGKTSLLDALRHTNVIDGEAGGITQRIGAYQVEWNNQKITFIDTPGHEAFTEMRARGANITDISILIVAADDGVKPQTVEAISHAKEANVPIIVAINKIDKVGANPTKVKQELLEYGLISPEWGGTTEMVEISAKQNLNLDNLLETILLTTEIMELKSNYKKRAKAVVIESRLDLQMGPVADILIQEGELKIGDIFVSGGSYGRVRSMMDDRGNKIRKATVSQPVEITGFDVIPEAGSLLYCVNNDKQAKKIVEDYKKVKKDEINKKKHISFESLSKELEEQQLKELKFIVRADSKGTAEALKESMLKLSNDKVSINVIQASAGAVTEGDVKLASASNAIIVAFSVRPTNSARSESEKYGVEIRNYNVIYHVTEDLEKAIKGMLDPEYKEVYNGRLEVTKVFKISNVGNIAGAIVVEGKISKTSKIRLLRDGIVIFDGEISSLKRYKDDVKEVSVTQDCGIAIQDYNDIKVGDIIEAYTLEEINK